MKVMNILTMKTEKKKKEYGIKLISHINKLRNGKRYTNDFDSEYLLVTNAKVTLLISQEQINKIKSDEKLESVANYAVSLDRITSLLWYKLGNGFGKKDYPANVSAVLRARVVLSSSIAKNAEKAFSDIKKQYEDGIITDEQVAARIRTLKNKPTLPEELKGDDIEEIMDFSPDFLRRYEEKVNSDRKSLMEKETIIKQIKDESAAKDKTILKKNGIIEEKDNELNNSKKTILKQSDIIKKQSNELEKYCCQEAEKIQKKERHKNIRRFIRCILLKLSIIMVIFLIIVLLLNKFYSDFLTVVSVSIGILGIVIAIIPFVAKDYKKYFINKK